MPLICGILQDIYLDIRAQPEVSIDNFSLFGQRGFYYLDRIDCDFDADLSK